MTENLKVSVIIPCYNPNEKRLKKTLAGLKNQTLSTINWELIIVDNASDSKSVFQELRPHWHPNHQVIEESKPGLTNARLYGFENSKSNLIVLVDDDNVLANDYLENAVECFENNNSLGVAGGEVELVFEEKPPSYINQFHALLAGRDFGEEEKVTSWNNTKEKVYPRFAPIGAGMILRRNAIQRYIQESNDHPNRIMDRTGNSLSSAGDNDIVMHVLEDGFDIAYFPKLQLEHLIPEERTRIEYLKNLNRSTSRSWVLVTHQHGICPWSKIHPLTIKPRQWRAWFRLKAWQGDKENIHWHGACGIFEGRSMIS